MSPDPVFPAPCNEPGGSPAAKPSRESGKRTSDEEGFNRTWSRGARARATALSVLVKMMMMMSAVCYVGRGRSYNTACILSGQYHLRLTRTYSHSKVPFPYSEQYASTHWTGLSIKQYRVDLIMLEVKCPHDKYTASYRKQSLRRGELAAARNAY